MTLPGRLGPMVSDHVAGGVIPVVDATLSVHQASVVVLAVDALHGTTSGDDGVRIAQKLMPGCSVSRTT